MASKDNEGWQYEWLLWAKLWFMNTLLTTCTLFIQAPGAQIQIIAMMISSAICLCAPRNQFKQTDYLESKLSLTNRLKCKLYLRAIELRTQLCIGEGLLHVDGSSFRFKNCCENGKLINSVKLGGETIDRLFTNPSWWCGHRDQMTRNDHCHLCFTLPNFNPQ